MQSCVDQVEVLKVLVHLSPSLGRISNLGRYKATYPLFAAKLPLFLNLLS